MPTLRVNVMPDGRACVHGTAVAVAASAILLVGPPGVGKSGIAAQMLASGATLVCDDLAVLSMVEGGLLVSGTGDTALELRGFGIVRLPPARPARLRAVLQLGEAADRLPQDAAITLLGHDVPFYRHPTTADIAAKSLVWLRSLR